MTKLTDLDLLIEDIPEDQADGAWKRLNIIAEAFMHEGHAVTITRTTYAPEETTE